MYIKIREDRPGWYNNIRIRNRKNWHDYFKKRYGESPSCQICGKKLIWSSNKRTDVVYFDHRHDGNETIKTTPCCWWANRNCNEINIATWEQCDFGILCSKCNHKLPTNRKEREETISIILYYFNYMNQFVKYASNEQCADKK